MPCRDEADPLQYPNKETVVAHKRRIEPIRSCAPNATILVAATPTTPRPTCRSVCTGYAVPRWAFYPQSSLYLPKKIGGCNYEPGAWHSGEGLARGPSCLAFRASVMEFHLRVDSPWPILQNLVIIEAEDTKCPLRIRLPFRSRLLASTSDPKSVMATYMQCDGDSSASHSRRQIIGHG